MDELMLLPVIESDNNKLDEAYEVAHDFGMTYQDEKIWVPKSFQYDGASIPFPAWQIIATPFNPQFMKAAVIHDWLYHTHQIEKKDADKLLYEILRKSKINVVKATLIRAAVESFGSWYWENDEEDLDYINRLREKIVNRGDDPSRYGVSVI